jgi:hypothetical protein
MLFDIPFIAELENIGKAKPIAATHVKIINEWTTIKKLATKYQSLRTVYSAKQSQSGK